MRFKAEVAWPRPPDPTDEQLEQLGASLPGFPSVIDDGAFYLFARFDVEGPAIKHALTIAEVVATACEAWDHAFADDTDPVQVSVYPADVGLVPGPLDLVGTGDVGRMLGVSKQRAQQLAGRLPAPVGHPAGAPVWTRSAVERVTATWDRSPGRPRTAAG